MHCVFPGIYLILFMEVLMYQTDHETWHVWAMQVPSMII